MLKATGIRLSILLLVALPGFRLSTLALPVAFPAAFPAAGPQGVGINLMDIVRALIRNGPRRDQKTSKGIKLVDDDGNRKATLRVIDERDAGIVMLVSLEPTGRDLLAHTARLVPPAPTSAQTPEERALPRPAAMDLRILRLEMPEKSGEREVVVVLLDPESLDALADSTPGWLIEMVGWDETVRLALTPKALRDLDKFRDRINSGRIG